MEEMEEIEEYENEYENNEYAVEHRVQMLMDVDFLALADSQNREQIINSARQQALIRVCNLLDGNSEDRREKEAYQKGMEVSINRKNETNLFSFHI